MKVGKKSDLIRAWLPGAWLPAACLTFGAALPGHGQSCSFPATSEFKTVEVMGGMSNPSHMAVLPDGQIFAIEQWTGKVHLHVPGKGTSMIGTVPTNAGRRVEDGMLGIVADLNYAVTKWIYILHTPAALGSNRLTRYSVVNGALANPRMILEYPRRVTAGRTMDQRHAGGGMAWNGRTGDLFISTGDDTWHGGDRSIYGPRDPDDIAVNALFTSANTNDLRGKCLRIRPLPFADGQTPAPGVGSTYAIPEGNLFPAGKFPEGKTRPEIYSMGHRNAYRVKVDSVTGWAFVGEVGADAGAYDAAKGPPGFDKITLLKGASNAGWPFMNGDKEPYKVRDYEKSYLAAGYKAGDPFDLQNLKNLSAFNTGLTDLPSPPVGPLVYYSAGNFQKGVSSKLGGGAESVMAGPTYNFNPNLASSVKLPPYFHRKVIFGDYSRQYIWLMTLDAQGTLKELEQIRSGGKVIDIDIGPDGTLYYLDYGAGKVFSVQYTGNQKDWKSCSFIKEGCMDPKYKEYDPTANLNNRNLCGTVSLRDGKSFDADMPADGSIRLLAVLGPDSMRPGSGNLKLPAWATGFEIYSMAGKRVFAARNIGGKDAYLPRDRFGKGLHYVRYVKE